MSKIDLDEFMAIEFFGEGYHSGTTQQDVLFLNKSFFTDELDDYLSEYTPYFYELDGKHSTVKGEVNTHEDVRTMFSAWVNGCGDFYPVIEVITDSELFTRDEILKMKDDHVNIADKLAIRTIITFDGEVVEYDN